MQATLNSTQALVQSKIKQMGLYAFVKWCKNLGIDAEDCIALITGKIPTVLRKPHLYIA